MDRKTMDHKTMDREGMGQKAKAMGVMNEAAKTRKPTRLVPAAGPIRCGSSAITL